VRAREAGDSVYDLALPPASRAQQYLLIMSLGLAPQALFCRPLRKLGI
jgi:hypothetical protein